jgi:LmbE family N-acetylglucosaminyl deacetylase
MFPDLGASGRSIFTSVFSDEPVPDIEAAIVVAHPGDEAIGASWVMVRLQDRASVYCLTKGVSGCAGGGTVAAAALAGVPPERCHNLGLSETELARDLETLVWLTTAAVTALRPRVLVTHACEGRNLDHDATAFAVHMTAKLMTRSGAAAPVVVELPSQRLASESEQEASGLLSARPAVKIEFGPESRKVKRRMLECHRELDTPVESLTLTSEAYVLATSHNPLDNLAAASGPYPDASWCVVDDFKRHARDVANSLSLAVLSTPSRA